MEILLNGQRAETLDISSWSLRKISDLDVAENMVITLPHRNKLIQDVVPSNQHLIKVQLKTPSGVHTYKVRSIEYGR